MLRDATHEPLIKRTVLLQLDHEGVVHLHKEVLAGLIDRSYAVTGRKAE